VNPSVKSVAMQLDGLNQQVARESPLFGTSRLQTPEYKSEQQARNNLFRNALRSTSPPLVFQVEQLKDECAQLKAQQSRPSLWAKLLRLLGR
jgi:hypothetical protein